MLTEPTPSALDGDDPVLQLRMAIATLAAEDRSSWTGSAMSELLVELLDVKERLEAELLRLVGSWDRNRAWEADGALSPRSWLTHRTPTTDTAASGLVKSARLLDRHDDIARALWEGEITTPHATPSAG